MNQDELRRLDVTPEMADQAHEQVDERLRYALAVREQIFDRALGLLKILVTLALAIVGVGATLQSHSGQSLHVGSFVLAASPLFVAAACMIAAIWDRAQGARGSDAKWWLRKDVIDGDPSIERPFLTACLALDKNERVHLSMQSNQNAIRFIRAGLVAALATPLTLAIFL